MSVRPMCAKTLHSGPFWSEELTNYAICARRDRDKGRFKGVFENGHFPWRVGKIASCKG